MLDLVDQQIRVPVVRVTRVQVVHSTLAQAVELTRAREGHLTLDLVVVQMLVLVDLQTVGQEVHVMLVRVGHVTLVQEGDGTVLPYVDKKLPWFFVMGITRDQPTVFFRGLLDTVPPILPNML